MPINKVPMVAFLCCFSCLSYADTQWVDKHTLLNQQHLWQEIEEVLQAQVRVEPLALKTGPAEKGLTYQHVKTIGTAKRFEHYQVLYRDKPVVDGQFVLVRNSAGQILQGLGAALRVKEVKKALDGQYFHSSLLEIRQRLLADPNISPETQFKDFGRAYMVWQGRLIGVFQVTATSKKGIHRLTISADTLSILQSEQGVDHFSDEGRYVAAGGIGGNEKMGAICYSPQPATMEACLGYQYDETTSASTELLFNDVSDTDSPLIFAEFDGYPFVVRKEGGSCFLENPYVQTINFLIHQTEPYEFDCNGKPESFERTKVDEAYYHLFSYSPENEAHFYGGLTMQFFHKQLNELFPEQNVHCVENGYCLQTLKQRVHQNSLGMTQAYWDGTYTNFGNGDSYLNYSLTTLSVIAHEAAHAVTHWNSRLDSQGESGAFNEAFSDITGLAVLDYLQRSVGGSFSQSEPFLKQVLDGTGYPQTDKKWWLGWDVKSHDIGQRYFALPSLDGRSIDHLIMYRANMSHYDLGGIFRKVFYELVKTFGWTIEEAFKLYLKANVSCLPAHASLDDASVCLMLVADSDVVSKSRQEAQKNVDEALHLVGLVAQTSEISNLAVTTVPQYDEFGYQIDTLPINEIESIAVDWGNGSTERWERNSSDAIYPFLQRAHDVEPDLLTRFKLKVVKTDNKELLAYRDYYSRPLGVICPPWFGGERLDMMNKVLINHQSLSLLPESYQEVLDQPLSLYLKKKNIIELGVNAVGHQAIVMLDTNRNGVFEEREVYRKEVVTDSGQVAFTLPEGFQPGKTMMRVVVGGRYSFLFSCGGISEGQVLDVKVNFSGTDEMLPTDYGFEIHSGNKVKFINSLVQSNIQSSEDFEQSLCGNGLEHSLLSNAISHSFGTQTCFEAISEMSSRIYTYIEPLGLSAYQAKSITTQTCMVLHPT
ncbi:M4 family metallopeptidase [Pseudoalteromonas sp. McH1-42]|uniref:M4 family metallopeptidase n=1 Tax=Pseudoalteromonas sp. McH1-42 TaxID=2917752 RepID=UPI001EF60052|nr:M4 family metallopeptidase [Pseudoalteromonas sp. McH1-42]MCG7561160.1 M4 family metallopeptidase [Pseudoalteromonas sp. McH1-42]